MLVLFETSAGYAVFKLTDENKLRQCDDMSTEYSSPADFKKILKLKYFEKFSSIADGLSAATASVDGQISKTLKKLIKKGFTADDKMNKLAVSDAKLGNSIQNKFKINCVSDSRVAELMRCIRCHLNSLVASVASEADLNGMALGLVHSFSRYKLKFSPDKIDTMIVQAISLLDDLDKELNNYVMRFQEWYGWHFPELIKIVTDNIAYVKSVLLMGKRSKAITSDFSDILPIEVEKSVKETAEVSMGIDISDNDLENIVSLGEQIVEIHSYRTQLYDYMRNRMLAVAPNLTILVGELVGARLIAHAGSLLNLAKHPASTVQILGSEKALFKALKSNQDTPKYGLIYHAQLVGQASTGSKGKISRSLAAKAALAARVDALREDEAAAEVEGVECKKVLSEDMAALGIMCREKVEARIRYVNTDLNVGRISGMAKAMASRKRSVPAYEFKSEEYEYKDAKDICLVSSRPTPARESDAPTKKKKKNVDDSGKD